MSRSPLPSGPCRTFGLGAALCALVAADMFAQCPTGTAPTVVTVTSATTSQATNCLQTSGTVTLSGGSAVVFQSGVTIYLLPGFTAQAGTSGTAFTAVIGPVITTTSLPPGVAGTSYTAALSAIEGASTGPFTWSGSGLPAWLALSPGTGVVSGTPSSAGTFGFSVQATDSGGSQSLAQSLSLVVTPPALTITTSSLPGGMAGTAYAQTLAAVGGTPPYSWSIASGAPPAGLTLTAGSGVIGGTPTGGGTFNFTTNVTDSAASPQTAARNLSIVVSAALTITITSLPSATVGTFYSQTLQATGGTPPYGNWTVASGSLPVGLSLNASGLISGTPTAGGSSTFTVHVTDSASPAGSSTVQFNMTVLGQCGLREFIRLQSRVIAVENSQSACLSLASAAGFGKVLPIGTGAAPANWYASGFNDSLWTAPVAGQSTDMPPLIGANQITDSAGDGPSFQDLFRYYFSLPSQTAASATLAIVVDNYLTGVWVNGTPVPTTGLSTVSVPPWVFTVGTATVPIGVFLPGQQNVIAIEIQNDSNYVMALSFLLKVN